MKKIILSLLAITVMLTLCACTVETTSSSSFTTTVTDENGNSTTTETKTENGITTSTTTTTNEDDPTGLRARWAEDFTNGAQGVSDQGNDVYFIYNASEDRSSLAAFMVTDDETGELLDYIYGYIEPLDDHLVIDDVEGKESLEFTLDQDTYSDAAVVTFVNNGETVDLAYVSLDEIINNMITIWEEQGATFTANHQ